MAGINEMFSSVCIYDEFGVVTGSIAEIQFPTGTCKMVRFKSAPGNSSEVFLLGNEFGCLFPMAAGDDTGWIATSNINRYYYSNVSGAAEYLYWWLQD